MGRSAFLCRLRQIRTLGREKTRYALPGPVFVGYARPMLEKMFFSQRQGLQGDGPIGRVSISAWPVLALTLLLLWAAPAHAATQGSDEPAEFPSLLSCLRVSGPLSFCGEAVPLEIPWVREELEKALLVLLWNRDQVILNVKRSGRYFPYIEEQLRERGMPDDLKYISVIESALRPHAGSHKGAVGYWQFIRPTALKYGLRVDGDIDERRNIFTSTAAALDYLTVLHEEFDSWTVACAAYNMGENGMRKRIRTQGLDDYYRLYLPRETMFYIFRAIATKMVFTNPARFGFHFQEGDYYIPTEFDRVTVTLEKDTPVADIATAAGTFFRAIKELNPQILGNDLVRGTHVLLLPRGAAKGFEGRLGLKPVSSPAQAGRAAADAARSGPVLSAPMPSVAEGRSELSVYVVRRGDNLDGIARRLGVSLESVLQLNGLRRESVIQPGQRLLVEQ